MLFSITNIRTEWKVEGEIKIWKGKSLSSFLSDFSKVPTPSYLRIEDDVEEYCPEMGTKSNNTSRLYGPPVIGPSATNILPPKLNVSVQLKCRRN